MGDVILAFEAIEKSFFGVQRAQRQSRWVCRAARCSGSVGENGAGKSTLMNLMGGVHMRRRRPHDCSTATLCAAFAQRCQ
jgi:ABC-type sugar transport system ATPase subunit